MNISDDDWQESKFHYSVAKNSIDEMWGIKEESPFDDEGCFITTAVCGSLNKPDDCEELTILRDYRDHWLRKQPDGENLVQEYYRIAPTIVNNINLDSNHDAIYLDILHNSIQPCIVDIKNGEYEQCKERYMKMVLDLKKKYYN